jgi:glc operon protein GlcG
MKIRVLTIAVMSAGLLIAGESLAQQPAPPNPLDNIPDAMPFDIPYGPAISVASAKEAIRAAAAEAEKHNWK